MTKQASYTKTVNRLADELVGKLREEGLTPAQMRARFAPQAPVPMKTVKNLMSGKEIQIPVDTPLSCDPSSETYWSM